VSDGVKAHLLADDPAAPGVLVVSAIQGLGGIGKSVLAAALSYDPDVQHRFPYGVLWATLGQQPDLLSLLSAWVQALGDYDFRPTTVDAASARLRTLLHDRAALLVVDDVWDPAHALPFRVGGPRCQVLVTTRRADVAEELGARLYQLDVMTPEQSLALLSARVGRPLEGAERGDALLLARAVGHLPLALELAAAQVARGVSWATLRQELEQEVARLEALEGPRGRRRGQLRLVASLSLSLDALRAKDEEAWRCFAWLGVLPEDAVIAAPMAATLWEQEEAQAADLLALLRDDALLQAGGSVRVGDRSWPSYRLHDLLHDLACRLLTAERPEGLGLPLSDAHAHLLDRYWTRTRDSLWHTLHDDGYVHAHLAWHMERAGWTDALHALLREETPEGRNGWYEARERLGQTAGYLADVELAWRLAEDAFTVGGSASAVGLQCRYTLIVASLNSLAGSIPPGLLVALVEQRLWSLSQGLAYARQVPEPGQRAEALAGLAPYLPEPLLRDALAAVREIQDEHARAKALAGLAPYLPEPLLRDALAVVREIRSKRSRAEVLTEMAPHLPDAQKEVALREALAAARESEDKYAQAEALTWLAPHLPKMLLREALAAAREIGDEGAQALALAGLAPHLPEALLREALAAAREIGDEGARALALAGLAPHLPEVLLREALEVAREIGDGNNRILALAGLASHLPERLLREEAAAARKTGDKDGQALVLTDLALRLAKLDRYEEALAAAWEIEDEDDQALALVELAPHLPEVLLRQALAAVRETGDGSDQTQAWDILEQDRVEEPKGLVHRLAELGRYEEALAAVREIGDGGDRALVLAKLAPHLPEPLLREALAMAREIGDGGDRALVLAKLAPHLPEPLLREALAMAREIGDGNNRILALTGLAPHLPEPLLREALAMAWEIGWGSGRAQAVAEVAPYLPDPLGEQALRETLAAAREIENEHARARALEGLVPHLPGRLLRDALAMAQEMGYEHVWTFALAELPLRLAELGQYEEALVAVQEIRWKRRRTETLAELASLLPETLKEEAAREALAVAREIGDGYDRILALARLAPHLPETLQEQALREALAAARTIRSAGGGRIEMEETVLFVSCLAELGHYRETLAELPLRLAELGHLAEALVAAREVGDDHARAQALARLAPHLPEALKEQALREALAVAWEIGDECDRAAALAGVGAHLPEALKEEAMQEALAVAQGIRYELARARALAYVTPYLPESLRRQAVTAVLECARTKAWAWDFTLEGTLTEALAWLVTRLAELGDYKEALSTAREIGDEHDRAAALAELARRLAALPRSVVASLWVEAQDGATLLRFSARRSRPDLLSDIRALAPLIAALGGDEAIAETFHAIQDVGRWWP
jgi:hypothetical protein